MNKNKKYIWSMLLLLLLIIATFYYLFRNNEMGKLLETADSADPFYLSVGLFCMFISIYSEALCIKVMMNTLKYKLSIIKCLKYAFVGFYYSSITPSSAGGQPSQILYMKKDGIQVSTATLCIMVVTMAYQVGMLLICFSSLLIKYHFITQNLGIIKYFSIFGATVIFLFVVAFIATTFHNNFLERLLSGFIRLFAKFKVYKNPEKSIVRMKGQLAEYRSGAYFLKEHPHILLFSLLMIVIKIFSRLSVAYAVYKAFRLSGIGYYDILALQSFLAIGVEFMPIPGGVGATEAGFMAVNSAIFGADKLVPALLLCRGINYYSFLIISGIVTFFSHFSFKSGKKRTAKV